MARIVVFLVVAAVCSSVYAQQMNCDCTQIVGSCAASIKWEPTGSGVSQGAKLRFTSTAPICSKISYYVDNTPYFNILRSGNTDEDSVFGTKPFTAETLSDIKCQVCKINLESTAPTNATSAQNPATRPHVLSLTGEWDVFHRSQCRGDSWNWTLVLTQSGDTLIGKDKPPFFLATSNFEGTVSAEGQVVLYQRSAPLPGIPANSTLAGTMSQDGRRIVGTRTSENDCAIDFTMTRK